ncbi:MAG: type VI secretion system-associated protein TagF [Sulfitobacter sp.]
MTQGYGAFGKMPSMGDFFHLNAPSAFVRAWDAWLQGAMMTSAEAGGTAWDDQYMTAPIWRFALSPGLAGAAKIIGVLMPSVDRVGRRFPLALMAPLDREGPVALDHLTLDATYEALEDVALASLEDGMDRERLSETLGNVPPPAAHNAAPLRRAGHTLVLTQTAETGVAPELAAGLIGTGGFAKPSLWSTLLDGSRRALICDGLPEAQEARALFDLNAPLWGDARPPT